MTRLKDVRSNEFIAKSPAGPPTAGLYARTKSDGDIEFAPHAPAAGKTYLATAATLNGNSYLPFGATLYDQNVSVSHFNYSAEVDERVTIRKSGLYIVSATLVMTAMVFVDKLWRYSIRTDTGEDIAVQSQSHPAGEADVNLTGQAWLSAGQNLAVYFVGLGGASSTRTFVIAHMAFAQVNGTWA